MSPAPVYNRGYTEEKIEEHAPDKELAFSLYAFLKPSRWLIVIAIVCLLISRAVEVAVPAYLGKVVAKAFSSDVKEAFDPKFATLLFALLAGGYFFDVISSAFKNFAGQKAIIRLRYSVYRHLLSLPLSYFDRSPIGRLITRTIHDVDQIDQMFSESLVPLLGSLFSFICIFIAVCLIDWQIAALLLLLLPLLMTFAQYFRKAQRRCYSQVRSILSAMNGFVQENLLGVMTVRNFGLQKREKKRFDEINDDFCTANVESMHYFSLFISGIDFFQSISLIAAFAILVLFSSDPAHFQAGVFFSFSLYALMIFRPILDIAERYNILQSAFAASERVFDVLKVLPEPFNHKEKIKIKEVESIEFDNVWFAYKDEDWVLKGASFKILKGQTVAIVGETGAGKSTVMSLLLRYYTPQKGVIRINGIDTKTFPLDELRDLFGIVLQDPVIFSDSLYQNIALFDEKITIAEVEAALKTVGLESLLSRSKEGILLHLHEQGRLLSLGEKQLISLARAALNSRQVLMLDEATSNIDSNTENKIQIALNTLLKDKTAIVIAHRFSTIKNASSILVFHKGKIVESGSHHELILQAGYYEKLSRLQFGKSGTV